MHDYYSEQHLLQNSLLLNWTAGLHIGQNYVLPYTVKYFLTMPYIPMNMDRGLSTMYIKSMWEKEANIQLSEDNWLNI